MPQLPTGIVTFLFTDIEGSTRLMQELGRDAYARVQDEQAAIMRGAIAQGNGTEIRTEGDSFFVVFATPADGVQACVAAQRELEANAWPQDGAIRVRMGLHTGEGMHGGDDYLGIEVNRAARIAALGHGGQILLSEATVALVANALPDGVALRDLGRHRLKDFDHRERLHDVAIDGLPTEFPALRSADARRTNLPAQRTSFVGREREVAEIGELLAGARLLTITGPGGTGKTRLALEVAAAQTERFPDGVFLVDLGAVTEPALVTPAIAGVLGVREQPGERLDETVFHHVGELQLLLVLDNLEQLLEAGPAVSGLLEHGPAVRVLATSRIPLRLTGEHEYRLDPLPLPDAEAHADPDALAACESVRMFVERASAVQPSFRVSGDNAAAIAAIVARLDGLPLALELAASKLRVLSPDELAARMEHRLPLLTGGARDAPERQRTLEQAIGWSYEFLDEPERRLLVRLSVFSGGWTLDAAEAVCGTGIDVLEGLQTLMENSLVRRIDLADGTSRFTMLETIREFAEDRRDAFGTDDRDDIERRHAQRFRDLAEEAEPHLTGEDQARWLEILQREHDNLRAALERAERSDDPDRLAIAFSTAAPIWRFWQSRGHLAEGRDRLRRLVAHPAAQRRDTARARALRGLGGIEYWLGEYAPMQASYEEALAIAQELDDPALVARALFDLSFLSAVGRMEPGAGVQMLRQALEVADEGDLSLRAQVWIGLGVSALFAGHPDDAAEPIERGLALIRRSGDRVAICDGLTALGGVAFVAGDMDSARARIGEATEVAATSDSPFVIATVILPHALLANHDGRARRAALLVGAAARLEDDFDVRYPAAGLAFFGDPGDAARAALGDDDFEQIRREGYELGLDEVIALVTEDEALRS